MTDVAVQQLALVVHQVAFVEQQQQQQQQQQRAAQLIIQAAWHLLLPHQLMQLQLQPPLLL
jgi:hypothetical protein